MGLAMCRLTAHRSAAIQAQIMNRREIALAALVHRLVLQVFGSGYLANRFVQVNIEQTYLKKDMKYPYSLVCYKHNCLYKCHIVFEFESGTTAIKKWAGVGPKNVRLWGSKPKPAESLTV
jgi:hypothetical protein